MELSLAHDVVTGKNIIEAITITREESLMLLMGACLTDEGDIVCLECGFQNECCICHEDTYI